MALAAFCRALAVLGVAIFTKSMSFFFVELDFARFGVAVTDFAIFQIVLVGLVVESDVAVFGFDHNGVGGKGGAGGEGDEDGGNNEVFMVASPVCLVEDCAGYPLSEKTIAENRDIALDIDRNSMRCLPTFILFPIVRSRYVGFINSGMSRQIELIALLK